MRSALTTANGFGNLQTDVKGRSATFTFKKSDNVKKKLDEIAATNKHVKGFKIN